MFNLTTTNEMTMSSLEIAELLGSRHDKVKQSIERLAERGVIELPPLGVIPTQTKPMNVYEFAGEQGKRDSIIVVAQLSPEFTARLVDRWQELENQIKAPALPNFNNAAEAARAWADQYEQNQKLAIDLNHAIETKAEIGSRREATAMATASAATRKANQLQKELDQSQEYATVKRMEMIHHGIKFNWRILKKASEDLGLPPIDVFDQNYGTVKGWHSLAWKKAYALGFERLDA